MSKYYNKKTLFYIVGSIIIFLGVFLYTQRVAAYKNINEKLSDWKLIPIPETYTELYFEDHASLPKKTKAGEITTFSFTVHNMEGIVTEYPYEVYFKYTQLGWKVLFEKGIVTLNPGESKTIKVSHMWRSSELQGKVVVELLGLDQYIDFLFPNINN